MKVLAQAIKSKFEELTGGIHNSFYTAIGGRLRYGVALENESAPYCVVYVITQDPDDMFVEEGEEILVQFSLFDNTNPQSGIVIDDICSTITDLFNNATLSVTGYSFIDMGRGRVRGIPRDSEGWWGKTVEYRILLEKV